VRVFRFVVENTIREPILQNPYYQGDKYVDSRVVTLL